MSTFRIDELNDEEVWEIGRFRIEPLIPGTIKARCDLPVEEYENVGLEADFNDDPPRHVDVLGWPELEEERLSIMNKLCYAVQNSGRFIDRP